jgi:uncharacterized protein YndB with AHSA1/START domain
MSEAEGKAPDLVMSRELKAPRDLVFDVWTKPEHLARWWGPTGWTLPKCEVDLRPGGAFTFVMRGPNGMEAPFVGAYVEVARPERIVFEGTIDDVPGHKVKTTVTFAESGGKTTVTVRQTFNFESMATKGAPEGWKQNLDRMEGYLRELR